MSRTNRFTIASLLSLTFVIMGLESAHASVGTIESVVIQTNASDPAKADGLIIISDAPGNEALKIEVLDHRNRVAKTFSLPKRKLFETLESRAQVANRTANKVTAALVLFLPTVIGAGQIFSAFLGDLLEVDQGATFCLSIAPAIAVGTKALVETIQSVQHGICTKDFSRALAEAVENLKADSRSSLILRTKLSAAGVIERLQDELGQN